MCAFICIVFISVCFYLSSFHQGVLSSVFFSIGVGSCQGGFLLWFVFHFHQGGFSAG